jgi:hypothetical protein
MTNEITTTTTNPPPVLRGTADLALQLRKHEDRIDEIVRITRCHGKNLDDLTQSLTEFDAFAERELPTIRTNLDRALNKPASSEDIAISVAMLAGCFPNIHNNDRTIFLQQLVRLLEGWEVGVGILGLAMRHLTLTCEYLPSIAKVREALVQAQDSLLKMSNRLNGDPEVGGDAGIYNHRQLLQRRIEELNGGAAERQETEWKRLRLERERKEQQKREQARAEAEKSYHVDQEWGFDMIDRILANPCHSAEGKIEQIAKVIDVVTNARRTLDAVART